MINSLTVNKLKLVLIIVLALSALVGIIFFAIRLIRPKVAGVYIESNPTSSVFINDTQVGRTPYRDNMQPGEYELRLVPDSFDKPLSPYSTKVLLVSGVETVVRREFGEFDETSAGEIISFEKIGKDEVSLVVITSPDSAQLLIDQKDRAFTPHKTSAIVSGEHTLTLSANGYQERDLKVKTHKGYKLTAIVKLAKSPIETQEIVEEQGNEPEVPAEEKPDQVEILDTGVGFLRVRGEPSSLGEEIARVTPGNLYVLLGLDEKSGWYKIEYEEGKGGWISNQYAKKIGPTNTPEISVTPGVKNISPSASPTKLPPSP